MATAATMARMRAPPKRMAEAILLPEKLSFKASGVVNPLVSRRLVAFRSHAFLASDFGPGRFRQRRAQIALSGRTGNRHNEFSGVFRTLCNLNGSPDIRARTDSRQDAFLFGKTARHDKGILVADLDAFGDLRIAIFTLQMKIVGNEAGTGPLDLVRSRLKRLAGKGLRDDGGIFRLDSDRNERRPARLDDLDTATDGSARADRGNEDIHFSVGVFPDFLRRGLCGGSPDSRDC